MVRLRLGVLPPRATRARIGGDSRSASRGCCTRPPSRSRPCGSWLTTSWLACGNCCETLLGACGRIGILTFHSGEDRLVKQAFREGLRDGTYDKIAEDVIRPTSQEIASNPRSRPTKFRWARKPSA
jgi:hypothetical protein